MPTTPSTAPSAALDDDRAAGQQQRVDAAELVEVDEPVLVDPGHLQADLVGVSGDHERGRAARIDGGDDVAQHVGLGGGDARDATAQDLLHGLFEAARPESRDQIAQKADVGRHDTYLLVGAGPRGRAAGAPLRGRGHPTKRPSGARRRGRADGDSQGVWIYPD